jgi:hypothetical protein
MLSPEFAVSWEMPPPMHGAHEYRSLRIIHGRLPEPQRHAAQWQMQESGS